MKRAGKILALPLAAFLFSAPAFAQAQKHPCATDAVKRGSQLLKLHFLEGQDDPSYKASIGDNVKILPPTGALKGKGKFDVLEVWGYIYKAEYRIRFLYAQIKGSCVLMGQEILEASDPY